MSMQSWSRHVAGMGAAVSVLVMGPAAVAFACESDADCAPGSTCEVEQVEICRYEGGDDAGVADGGGSIGGGSDGGGSTGGGHSGGGSGGTTGSGPQDAGVVPADAGGAWSEVCETHEQAYCRPSSCESDADCGSMAVCQSWEYEECVWPELPDCDWETTDCEVWWSDNGYMEPTECFDTRYSECTPRHEAPCQQDADCGEGFDCVPQQMWLCEGGGSDGGSTTGGSANGGSNTGGGSDAGYGTGGSTTGGHGDDAGTWDDGGCTLVPLSEGYCQLRDLPCEGDDGCPEGMTCQERYTYQPPVCDDPSNSGGGTTGSSGGMADGGSDWGDRHCEWPEPSVTLACQPAYWRGGGSTGGSTGGGDAGAPWDAGTSDAGGGGADGGGANAGSTGGSGGTTGVGHGGADGGADEPGAVDDEDGEGGGRGLGRGLGVLRRLFGCSAAPGAPPDASWLAILGVLGGMFLRRKPSF